jgi:quaternary ammonium compound-resistance protein SugE
MNWFILFVAGLFEVVWALGLKYTDGFTRLWPSLGTAVAMAISAVLLAIALKTLPVGTGYAIWVGIGAIGTAIAGIVLFGESVSTLKIVSLVLLIAGMTGLKMSSAA